MGQVVRVGTLYVAVPRDIARLLSLRMPLIFEERDDPTIAVEREPGPDGLFERLDVADAALGIYGVRAGRVHVFIPEDPFAAEAVLRAAVVTAVLQRGGILVHGAAIRFGGAAAVAIGPSGAGKSTLARLGRAAGGSVLSDESVVLFEDGTVMGTPFRSDPDMAPKQERVERAVLLGLVKGEEERFIPLDAKKATSLILRQAYRPPTSVGRASFLLERCSRIARTGCESFVFRKHPEAGAALRRRVETNG